MAQGPLLLLDGLDCLVYNMLIKGADTIVYAYPFPAKMLVKNSTFHFARAGVLFFMVYMVKNFNNQYCKSKQHHERLVCSHKNHLLPIKARIGGIHTLSAPLVSMLYCQGAFI